ncbi:sulfur carrier protein ThiS [Nocardiopsis sp. RSe5-2]|uniref:Sulfur carrier protein ThiS n=1 Tax=Nocardiopsis endophytica TaxID=3018445 RepID=A0ABT4UBZ6_9ACTN|nr:sulfur carrier protein ThiS [Nocardiopsis endophytica]MDA2814483.1 sulfur carrier protein ThiS [Nocardiopsis endophytica]
MEVTVNGERRTVAPGSTVGDVVRDLTRAEGGVAASLNDEVVPRTTWDATPVAENDRVDVLTAVQGG